MNKILGFRGEYSFLSNMYECEIFYNGIRYLSSEHAYLAAKADCKEDWLYIKTAPTPKLAKRRAKEIKIRLDFYKRRLSIMEKCLIAKFSIPELRQKLLDTGDAEIVEVNWWNDTYWGVCNDVGENNLGKLLMKVRKLISEDRM